MGDERTRVVARVRIFAGIALGDPAKNSVECGSDAFLHIGKGSPEML
ncbi:MAG: hypothetical protein JW780_06425 [Clostridiales bacterium]|nr:hypothetical protein [Clostridiales bacterium]